MMLSARGSIRRREGVVAVAVDFQNKGSQYALKWAIDQIASGRQTVNLIHVKQRAPLFPPFGNNELSIRREPDNQTMELFLPFRCFCLRRKVECEVVVLEDPDIANALAECVNHYGIDTMVLGASSRFSRLFRNSDIPSSLTKMAPDFCNVYVISKAKIVSTRAATRLILGNRTRERRTPFESRNLNDIGESVTSQYYRDRALTSILHDELSTPELDVSCASSERRSTDSSFLSFYQNIGNSDLSCQSSKHLNKEKGKFMPFNLRSKSFEIINPCHEYSSDLQEYNGRIIRLSHNLEEDMENKVTALELKVQEEDMENKVTALELKVKQTVEMYNAACYEALTEKQKARELQQIIAEGEKGLEEERSAKEAAFKILHQEKAVCKEAMDAAETARNIAEIEAEKRVVAEMKVLKEAEEKKKVLDAFLLFLINTYVNNQSKST